MPPTLIVGSSDKAGAFLSTIKQRGMEKHVFRLSEKRRPNSTRCTSLVARVAKGDWRKGQMVGWLASGGTLLFIFGGSTGSGGAATRRSHGTTTRKTGTAELFVLEQSS